MAQRWTYSQVMGRIALAVIAFLGIAWCVSGRGSSNSVDERPEADARDAELDAKRRDLVKLLCTAAFELQADELAHRLEGHVVYVRADAWALLNVDQRAAFAGWVGLCHTKDDRAIVRDGQSGETVAKWSLVQGYMPE